MEMQVQRERDLKYNVYYALCDKVEFEAVHVAGLGADKARLMYTRNNDTAQQCSNATNTPIASHHLVNQVSCS